MLCKVVLTIWDARSIYVLVMRGVVFDEVMRILEIMIMCDNLVCFFFMQFDE